MLGWKRLGHLLISLLISVISIGLITIQAQAEGRLTKLCLTECSPQMGVVSAFSDEADILLAEFV